MYRKHKVKLFLLLVLAAMQPDLFAQDLPPCMAAIKRTTTEFNRKLKLQDGRSVYAFTVKRPPKCMDCPSGVTYYDSACVTVANFTIGYAPVAFIRTGYSPSDFPEASTPMFARRLAANAVPSCIAAAIARPDSLKNAGVTNIDEVLLAGQHLYYFQIPVAAKKGCYDCATAVIYYDSLCNVAARFMVGGYAGVEAPAGFTKQDFMRKQKLKTLWSSGTNANPPAAPGGTSNPFPQPVTFIISQVADTIMNGFAEGDELKISTAEGLYHYRNGSLVNRYKIIPQKIKQQKTSPCLVPPCPTREEDRVVYYLEPLNRYFYIDQLPDRAWLNFSVKKIYSTGGILKFNEGDWKTGYRLKKK